METSNNNEEVPVSADFYFAIIPEWVLALPVSANAIRVYCCLRRYADNTTGECFPSRKTLAMRSRISVSTLDRAIKELDEHGAISIIHRKSEAGDYTSNLYIVRSFPKGVASNSIPPRIRGDGTGVITRGEQTKANRTISNNSARNPKDRPPLNENTQYESQGAVYAHLGWKYSEVLAELKQHPKKEIIVQSYLQIARPELIDRTILDYDSPEIAPRKRAESWQDKYD